MEKVIFKGIEALKIQSNYLKVVIIPEIGGKVASIYNLKKDFELLFQNKDEVYKRPKIYDAFENFDAAGFDDAFPTIDKCIVSINDKNIEYPDHGEIWSGTFDYTIEGEKIILSYKSEILPYSYNKTLFLEKDSLICEYNIKNTGDFPIPCIWAFHCLVNCEEDMEIVFPRGTNLIENVHDSKYLGEEGTVHKYPQTLDLNGEVFDLSKVLPKSFNNTEKYYVKGKVNEGKCGIYYPSKDISYNIYYDEKKLPYLGFWITEGGFRGDYNCALEPTNGYYDDIIKSRDNNCTFTLKPGETLEFDIKIELR
ncbi:DUF5107 domain-containing protein [Clostridium sp. MSJ-4]|uniref:DUF5107 domain-containing protein n=1 Tax=Clostridium simiarum TaxID=2841506 RepID=A0ABS6F4P2_9CLOT|nr:DUF5107 domain-containing protein [Clostridium simiarum]MBU5593365.1 DUF5107 domain-containing protein [Clostridium simiarum]